MANDLTIVTPDKSQGLLEQLKPSIMKAVAKKIPDSFWAGALVDARRNPKLGLCTAESIVAAVSTAFVAGINLGDGRGSGWLVPFKNRGVMEAQLMIGYRSIVNQAYNCPRIASIVVEVVREGDVFDYELGTSRKLMHKPVPGNTKPITFAYMVAEIAGSSMPLIFVMDKGQLDAVKRRSKAVQFGGDTPWLDREIGEAEMCKKTVMRRGCKQLPFSVIPQAMASALEQEDAREYMTGRQADVIINAPATITNPSDVAPVSTGGSTAGPEAVEPPPVPPVLDAETNVMCQDSQPKPAAGEAPKEDQVKLFKLLRRTATRLGRQEADLAEEMKAKCYNGKEHTKDLTPSEINAAQVWLVKQKGGK